MSKRPRSRPRTVTQADLFTCTLEVCRAQLDLRRPDAIADVERIRDKYLASARYAVADSPTQAFHADAAARLTELIEAHRDKNFLHERGAETPEAKVRGRSKETTVERLVRKKALEPHHGRAACEIAAIYQGIVGALDARSRVLDGVNVDGGPPWDYARMADWVADKHLHCYIPWARQIRSWTRGLAALAMVQQVICLGVPLDAARRRWRFGYSSAFAMLRDALDLFADIEAAYEPPEDGDAE